MVDRLLYGGRHELERAEPSRPALAGRAVQHPGCRRDANCSPRRVATEDARRPLPGESETLGGCGGRNRTRTANQLLGRVDGQ